ncbi:MAG: 2-hydroxycyclohexanecarboxyl-CoA dehydrogenase [Nocardioidaceae bacterium]|nr:2-hydroxycyclohexanecarboxyl-CoA dehydrogenase [Nocardioidaceae bacterium]
MSGKVALVTGAAGAIGGATAESFGRAGARVALTDRDEDGMATVVDSLRAQGVDAHGIPCDVTDYGGVCEMVTTAREHFGTIDALAHVAGGSVNKTSPFLSQDPTTWTADVQRNLLGTIYVTRAVLQRAMVVQGSGAVVLVSSDAARAGSLGEAVYSASKGGIIAFTRSMAREMARHHIRVNCVSPGPTDGDQIREAAASAPAVIAKIQSMIAMKRFGTPEEQANAIVFLCSELSSYVTGQVLSVNGGLQMY